MNQPNPTSIESPHIDDVVIPDRFEALSRIGIDNIGTIIVPVLDMLNEIDSLHKTMKSSGRGVFMILRGNSGAGKTTFLHTLGLYRENVSTISIAGGEDVPNFLRDHNTPNTLSIEVIVLEEREAALSFTDEELESWLHAINGFIRSDRGKNAMVVWPCNSDKLKDRLVSLSRTIGGRSLLGSKDDAISFPGPSKNTYTEIASRTLAVLNQGAGLSDFGLTAENIDSLAAKANTVGDFLGDLRDAIIEKQQTVSSLLEKEHPNVWVVVIAGNEPDGEVAGLTRGNLSLVDMDRLMTSTEANIVQDLKKIPEKLGLLATVLNAKILHLPVLAATASVRAFSDDRLQDKLKKEDFALSPKKPEEATNRLQQCELGSILQLGKQKTLVRGKKLGDKSITSFVKVATVAQQDDASVNRAIGNALLSAGLIESFNIEVPLSGAYSVRSDMLITGKFGKARIEMMWRTKTGRADIANYTLKKLENYGKAIGFIK
ncbi:hypothetical protein [Paenirhodobacter enshiensis]|uniref:hypothetical protein n=1 Tax=Paenirhodobacter enshiensis TaxID=1105367 RepID=UPI001267A395|nr:hypothetical protein [Paenirhodobacter enshiensis]